MQKAPSLVDLCVRMAIGHVRYLGDVGETDPYLLARILPHCRVDQLIHIENSTKGRDLSPITNKLWKRFYTAQFGVESTNVVVERMRENGVTFTWKQLYEAKEKAREEATQLSIDRMKLRYQEENAKKQSRQVKVCAKVPPSSKKRSFFGGAVANNIYNTKSGLMKKAKIEFVNSREMKNIAAMKNKVVHKNRSVPSSIGKPRIPSGLASSSSAYCVPSSIGKPRIPSGLASSSSASSLSSSKLTKPTQGRF